MKNKKGFTLVELLAVIIILAIVALVVVPVVMGVIKDARKKSAIESFRGYMDAVEKTIIRDSMKATSELPEKDSNGCYNLNDLNPKIKIKGDKPVIDDDDDKLCVENGKITSVSEVEMKDYKLEYKDGDIYVNGQNTSVQINSIELTNENKIVYIGKTLQLTTKIEPSNGDTRQMKYKSSNESVATVTKKGVVTGVSKGNVTITVTTRNNKTATINLEVKKETESITITNGQTEIEKDKTLQLTTSLTPSDANPDLTWESSNTSIATVSNSGLVTGKAAGTVTITVKTENNKTATKSLKINDCEYTVNQQFNFGYTGSVQTFSPKCTGKYKLEVWGAQGGQTAAHSLRGGYGGYSIGTYSLNLNQSLYIYVGGQGGVSSSCSTWNNGGWNGGGGTYPFQCSTTTTCSSDNYNHFASGGGATDISTIQSSVSLDSYGRYVRNQNSYNGRIIVAGGGGGGEEHTGGEGGGWYGGNANGSSYAGNQTKAGDVYVGNTSWGNYYIGGFGYGASMYGNCIQHYSNAGGGGGYYGGGGWGDGSNNSNDAGGGGSGYIGGVLSDSTYGITRQMYMYNDGCTASSAESTKTTCTSSVGSHVANAANTGNGYARITYLGK